MWVARDKNGELILSATKPIKNYDSNCWRVGDTSDCTDWMLLNESLFPDLTWEDEPEEVYISLKNPKRNKRCTSCGEMFSYRTSDINYTTIEEPWSAGYFEDYNYVICPHCGKSNQV